MVRPLSFEFSRNERADRELLDIYGLMGSPPLAPPTCDVEFWPSKDKRPANRGRSDTGKVQPQPIVDPVEQKRQALVAEAERMKRHIQETEQRRKRRATPVEQQPVKVESHATPVEIVNEDVPKDTSSDSPQTSISTAHAAESTTSQDGVFVQIETEVKIETKEETFERLRKREQELKTQIFARQVKAEIDAQETELRDALSKVRTNSHLFY